MRIRIKKVINNYLDRKVAPLILSSKKFNSRDVIIIFAEARGGSTWLMEILKSIPNTCINWEPLHEKGVLNEFNLGLKPFIPRNDSTVAYLKCFDEIHRLKRTSTWTRKYLNLKDVVLCKYVITKYVNANLLIPWMMENFKFKYKPIVLLRHPIDTTISHIKAFGDNKNYLKELEIPKSINNERYIKHYDYIHNLETLLEKRIAFWCMNNCPTIEQLENLDVNVVFYSDLLMNTKEEINKMLKRSDILVSDEVLKTINYRKASRTNFNKTFILDPNGQLNKNFDRMDKKMKDKLQNIFDYFDFKLYTAYSPLPKKEYLKNK